MSNHNSDKWKLIQLHPCKKGHNNNIEYTGTLQEIVNILHEKGLIERGADVR